MDEKTRKESYEEGYKAAKKDFEEKKELCAEFYTDGYKAGFRDGFKAAQIELSKMMLSQMSPEMKQKIQEGAQPQWWPIW